MVVLEDDGSCEEDIRVDVVFPVLHGRNGEDGRMQGLLQIAGLPFVGSDTISSAASMDKAITKVMVEDGRRHRGQADAVSASIISVMQRIRYGELLRHHSRTSNDTYPLFVKPANAGSSVGISKVKTRGRSAESPGNSFCRR